MKKALLAVGTVVIFLSCFTSNLLAVDGWASQNGGTTGGADGNTATVSTAADFKTYVELASPYIVQVSGTIDLGSVGGGVKIKSNKTIMGLNTSSTIIGRLGFTTGSSNIIIQGLNITNPSYSETDGISVKNTVTNLFITKCNVYDCGDGCIDISNASDFSGSDDAIGDIGKLRITFHHNWWGSRCDQRMPRGRYGKVHVYNNYYGCPGNTYCIGVGVVSQLRVESNYFDNVNEAWRNWNTSGYTPGIIGWNTGNVFVSTSIPTWAPNDYNTVFAPTYSYTLDTGSDVKTIVMAGAGNVGGDITPPSEPVGLTAIAGYIPVVLDWNNNSESDLAGYNVYRSTTSGGGYGKLNGALLTDSNYIDNINTTDTTYYYVVTAVDANSNESNCSNKVSGGLYGDFTGNDIVSLNDLAEFAGYWLLDNCNETAGVDLNDDCMVNFYEFAVFADNWLIE
jgi:pectate lyase